MEIKNFESIKKIVTEAGEKLLLFYKSNVSISYKGPRDLVTEADIFVESFLREQLYKAFPSIPFIGEETGYKEIPETCFIVDPLDGTTNFAHAYPAFCISLGYMENNEIIFGTVLDPLGKELFYAIKGTGAFCNEKRIHVSHENLLKKSLLATGFPYLDTLVPHILNYFNHILPKCQGIRRSGSAALDLCYTACGRFDGFFELGLKPWDVTAGLLIVNEAGGMTTNLKGVKSTPFDNEYLATNGKIHDQILEVVKDSDKKIEQFKEYFKSIIDDTN